MHPSADHTTPAAPEQPAEQPITVDPSYRWFDPRAMPRPLVRILAILVGGAAFLSIASVINPRGSSARSLEGPGQRPALPAVEHRDAAAGEMPPAPERNAKGWPLLGELTSNEHRIWIYGSPQGPRYTVTSIKGWILAENLLADEVYRSFPDLDVEGMFLDPPNGDKPVPVMMVDPDDGA